MRTVTRTTNRSRRHRAGGRTVAVLTSLALAGLLSACAPFEGSSEPEPAAASSSPTSRETDEPTATATNDDAAEKAEAERQAQQQAEDEAAAKAEAKKKAQAKAEAEAEQQAADEAERKAEEEAADEEAADEAEREAAEQAEQEAAAEEAEQKAAEKAEAKAQAERDAMPQPGATGEKIVVLQQQLQDLGYFITDVDGSFGPATTQAVWALQKAAGLYRDGVVGPQTQEAIDAGTRPSAHTSSGKAVEIDLDRQLLMTVENGKVTHIINASSGNGESYEAVGRTYTASTPRGSFAVYMSRDGMHESSLELGSMWRPKYFSGGFAVHGSGSIPPYPASHGCVRVSNSAMNWLWDSWGMPEGTPVVLY